MSLRWIETLFSRMFASRLRSSQRTVSLNLIAGLEARTLLSSYIESESNDTTATANAVTVPVQDILQATSSDWLQIEGSISVSGDSDYFRFTLANASGVFFDIDSVEIGLSATLDSILNVFDVSGVAVPAGTADDNYDFEGFAAPGTSVGNATTFDAGLYLDLAAGDYFVRVRDFGTQTGNYYLKLLADATYSATVPVFDSLSGAADTLYLDFDGHSEASGAWGAFTAVAYNINNGTASIFTPAERLAMRNIWTVVSEDFSPFNINVTTVAPPTIANGVAHRQVITSSSPTIVGQPGTILGVAFVSSYAGFANNDNVAFTFTENFSAYGGGTSGRVMASTIEIGNTTSHEFGHALGLQHFDSNTLPQYILATPDQGLNREIWGNATNLNSVNQDDMEIISNATNTFGYRVDDHGNTQGTATVLSPSGPGYVASGIIAQIATDFDVFRIVATGPTTIRLDVSEYSNDLDTELRLYDVNGVLLATHDPGNSFDALITQTLAAGTYYVEVRSDGEAGEAGQYALTVTTDTTPPNAPPVLNDQSLPDLAENSANGTVVGTVAATDPDVGQTLSYVITGGNTGGAFAINASTGQITVVNVSALDFETNPVFSLTVQVTDNGSPNLSDTGTVTIQLTDVDETPVEEVTFSFSSGVLTVTGTSLDDTITVLNDAGTIKIDANGSVISTGLAAASVTSASVTGLGGNDVLELDTTLGTALLGTLLGGEGDDTLVSGLGQDTLNGGNGTDTANYIQGTTGVKVSLALATAQATVGAGSDTLAAVENLTGSNFNDTLTGSTGANVLSGGLGVDSLTGGLGADLLDGGEGNDALKFKNGDTLIGGAGTDTATVTLATAGITLNLVASGIETVTATTSTFANTFDGTGATWVITITGGSGADTMTGGNMADKLTGGAGNDVLVGNAGIDTLTGGLGADTFDGGEGNDAFVIDNFDTSILGGNGVDKVTVTGATAAVTLNLVTSQIETVLASASAFQNVFDATGATWVVSITGGSGNDTITGGTMNDTLVGGAGNDALVGNGGNDSMTGGLGIDTYDGGEGNDALKFDHLDTTIIGGNGTDTATVTSALAAVNLNLFTGQIETVSATTSTFHNMFDATGATWIVIITGGSGNDTLIGGTLNDTLTGGSGDDVLIGNAGDDKLTGGIGNDTISYATAAAFVNVNLATKKSTGGAGTDTLATIENIIGSLFDDFLTGDAFDNILDGNDGVDTIIGGGGSDTILNP